MLFTPSKNEQIILHALEHHNAVDEDSAMGAQELRQHCINAGLKEDSAFEMAVMNLIDHDKVEYEMDDNMQASQFWLLEE
jgi:mannitol-specific phosphotransferase system IIBC component